MLPNPIEVEKIDPRIKRTRVLIESTFMQLMDEKSFHDITVQDITQRAEVNRATFYAHYADKFELMDGITRSLFRAELEKRTLKACTYSRDNLFALLVAVCEFVSKNIRQCKNTDAQFESLIEGQVRNQILDLIGAWMPQTPNYDPTMGEERATAVTWAIYGLAAQWSKQPLEARSSAEEFAKKVLPLFADAMG